MITPRRIIVVGGNAAGPAAAAKAKRTNPNAEVILFEAGDFISTGTCEMPYVLSGQIRDVNDIVFFNAGSFKKEKGVDVYLKHKVEGINRRDKTILVRNFSGEKLNEIRYDKLILTTGSKAKQIPGLRADAKNVFTLKSVNDLILLTDYIRTAGVKKAAVIGSGYIGLEIVDALKNLMIEVSLFEKEQLPLPSSEAEIGLLIKELLRNNEIDFWNNAGSLKVNYSENNDYVMSLEVEGRILEFDLYIIAAGFIPNTELAEGANLETGKDKAIKIDNKLKTSDANIYAAGDNVEVINAVTRRPDYIPLATVAYQYGHAAGENAAGGNAFAEPVIKNLSVKILGKYFISTGLSSAEADRHGFVYNTVSEVVPSLVKVMPESSNVFGKIIFEKDSKKIIGASFFGGKEVSGYGDLISMLIKTKQPADILSKINYNYTPPLSPFVNLLYVLGKKI